MSTPKFYALTPQFNDGRCQFCAEDESRDRPFVAVLTNFSSIARHWVHAGECHTGHSNRIKAEREQRQREKAA